MSGLFRAGLIGFAGGLLTTILVPYWGLGPAWLAGLSAVIILLIADAAMEPGE